MMQATDSLPFFTLLSYECLQSILVYLCVLEWNGEAHLLIIAVVTVSTTHQYDKDRAFAFWKASSAWSLRTNSSLPGCPVSSPLAPI